jgi:hypothetical protein
MGMAMRIRDLLGEDVWHGSPHHFDRFSTDHMDSGEGCQEYGWGLYFTSTSGGRALPHLAADGAGGVHRLGNAVTGTGWQHAGPAIVRYDCQRDCNL